MAQQTWTDSIKAHLELLVQLASKLPANEKLEPKALNEILDLTSQFHSLFIFQMELQGFKTERKSK